MTRIVEQSSLTRHQIERLFEIWNAVYPVEFQYGTIDELIIYLPKMTKPRHYVAYDQNDRMVGWLVTLERNDTRWFIVLVDKTHQKVGLGSALLNNAKLEGCDLSGWVVLNETYKTQDGSPYQSPAAFYAKAGFEVDRSDSVTARGLTSYRVHWRNHNS